MNDPKQPLANPLDEILSGPQPTPEEAFQMLASVVRAVQVKGGEMLQLYKALNVLHGLVEEHAAQQSSE